MSDIDQLNSFLRGELSAVETYDQVITRTEDDHILTVLRDNRESHARRVQLLEERIRGLGGEPAQGSGPWGSLARSLEAGANALGTSTALALLEEGEDHGLADYRRDVDDLSQETRRFVVDHLLHDQQSTHDKLVRLRSAMGSVGS